MKIKKSEVDKMIKEEFQKMLEKKKLSNRLSQINESLDAMDKEDNCLEEVEAGGEMKVASSAWTGKPNGDVKFKPEFEKKGSHLLEDEDEDSIEVGGEENEMGSEMDMDENPMGEFEAKFAEIGKAIDAKMAAGHEATETPAEEAAEEMGGDDETAEEMGGDDEDFEEVEVSDDSMGDDSLEITADNGGEKEEEEKEEIDESVEEPLEGNSVAQETGLSKPAGDMTKDTHVKEGKKSTGVVINEAKKPEAKNIFTEGLDVKKKTALLEEMNRMKKFAGLSKDEE